MSTKFYVIAVWTLLSFVVKVNAQDKVECWDRFELSFKQVTKENPFDFFYDIHLCFIMSGF